MFVLVVIAAGRVSFEEALTAAEALGQRPPATFYIWRTMIWSGEVNGRARRG